MVKTKPLFLLCLIIAAQLLLHGCGKDNTSPKVAEITLDRANVALNHNASISVNVTGGNGGYTAISSDESIARATINGNVITITATATQDRAQAVIVITDKMYKRQNIDVVVAKEFDLALSTTESALDLGVAGKDQLTITINSGNTGYKAEAIDNTAAMVEIDNTKLESHGKFTVKAIAAGIAKIKVTDSKGKETTVTLTITEPAALSLSKTEVDLTAVQGSEDITVNTGNGDYKVTVADPLVAKASVKDNIITVRGKTNGSTTIAVEDKKGKKAVINVSINGGPFAMDLSDQYFGYTYFSDIAAVDPSVRSLKKVTFELTCKISGYRGLQTFMGLEGNLIIRGKHDASRPTHPIEISGLGDRITLETTKSFNLNEWMNIALVVDCDQAAVADKYKLYINGVPDVLIIRRQEATHSSVNLTSSNDGSRFAIGRAVGQDFRAMRGTVSEARIWTEARTAQQIKDNMCGLTGTNTGLLARWDFSAGAETAYIQDSNGGKYETNLILANAKLNGDYTPVNVPASAFVSKGCPN